MTTGAQGATDIKWRQGKYDITDNRSPDLIYITRQLKMAWNQLHVTQRKAEVMCTICFEELALYKAEDSGTTQGGELK